MISADSIDKLQHSVFTVIITTCFRDTLYIISWQNVEMKNGYIMIRPWMNKSFFYSLEKYEVLFRSSGRLHTQTFTQFPNLRLATETKWFMSQPTCTISPWNREAAFFKPRCLVLRSLFDALNTHSLQWEAWGLRQRYYLLLPKSPNKDGNIAAHRLWMRCIKLALE